MILINEITTRHIQRKFLALPSNQRGSLPQYLNQGLIILHMDLSSYLDLLQKPCSIARYLSTYPHIPKADLLLGGPNASGPLPSN